MAAQSDIDAVKLELPDEIADYGLTDDVIGAFIDTGITQTKTLLSAWRVVAAKLSTMTDVSESGSSRSYSQLHAKAMAMVTHFQMLSDREDVLAGTNSRQAFASHTAVRV